jgi:hypothetical protein
MGLMESMCREPSREKPIQTNDDGVMVSTGIHHLPETKIRRARKGSPKHVQPCHAFVTPWDLDWTNALRPLRLSITLSTRRESRQIAAQTIHYESSQDPWNVMAFSISSLTSFFLDISPVHYLPHPSIDPIMDLQIH